MRRGGVFRAHGSADEVEEQVPPMTWLKMFKYMTNKGMFGLSLLFHLISATSPYVLSLLQGEVANIMLDTSYITGEQFLEKSKSISRTMLIALVAIIGSNFIHTIFHTMFRPKFSIDVNMALYNSILKQDMEYFDFTATGTILSRFTSDLEISVTSVTERLTMTATMIVQFSSGLIIGFSQSWKVTLIMLSLVPLYALSNSCGNKYVDKLWLDFNDRDTAVATKAEEILTSIRTIRSFDAELREYKNYKEKMKAVHEIIVKASFTHGLREFFSTITHWGMSAIVMMYTGRQAYYGEIEPGTIVTIMSIINNWSWAFAGIFTSMADYKKANVSTKKIIDIVEREPKIKNDEGGAFPTCQGKIEFRNVSFTYSSRNTKALDDVSFVIQPGETVALVGESGCGKSTILGLLQRFYDIQEGQILIDDVDIKTIRPFDLRQHIAIVPQSPVMFSNSVKNNIAFGKPEASKSQIIAAAKAANAHTFIKQLSNEYHTNVQQSSLSGGQKQRICIARAVMINPKILFLDEATAALDTESEQLVQEALVEYQKERTALIVAHRLSTVRTADRILVMSAGKIVEEGTHDSLIVKGGFYSNLVKNQII